MPDLIRHPVPPLWELKGLDVLARLGSLRLPSVARLEFIPMKIGAGMTPFYENGSSWTRTN
jgi:hypothetical protein